MGKVSLLAESKGIFGSAGDVSIWDFSRANTDKEARVDAVQKVASICFNSSVKVGSSALYDKLMAESLGLPSSSFEFVPVLLNVDDIEMINSEYMRHVLHVSGDFVQIPNVEKYGHTIIKGNDVYKLTNLRALLYDIASINTTRTDEDKIDASSRFFNTKAEEIEIIKDNFFVFNSKIDIVTARQFIRHRVSWQELSRRYVSGKKVPFEVYLTEDMASDDINIEISDALGWEKPLVDTGDDDINITAVQLVMLCLKMYDAAIENGVKPQEARRIIPQGAMTQMWSAWMPGAFKSMIELRTEAKAQWEIRTLAKEMERLVERTR